jgi:transposase
MRESVSTDAIGGRAMPPAYSKDIRASVIARVKAGDSRREAARHFEVSHSTAVNWLARFRATGDCVAKPRGGSSSPLEKHADCLLRFAAEQPDLTLDEVVSAMGERGIPGSRAAVRRFFARRNIILKKKPARRGTEAQRRGAGTPELEARARDA